jgi:hypothetical protein
MVAKRPSRYPRRYSISFLVNVLMANLSDDPGCVPVAVGFGWRPGDQLAVRRVAVWSVEVAAGERARHTSPRNARRWTVPSPQTRERFYRPARPAAGAVGRHDASGQHPVSPTRHLPE